METDCIPKPQGLEKPFHNKLVGKKLFLLVTVLLASVTSSKVDTFFPASIWSLFLSNT